MKIKIHHSLFFTLACLIVLHPSFCPCLHAQGTAFTYQGRLDSGTNPAAGSYDFTLNWTPDESQFAGMGVKVPPPAADNAAAPPDLFTAIEEQMGLKLVATKAMVDILVIDHVEKPSAN